MDSQSRVFNSFPDSHPEVDLELLHNGFHLGFINCVDMLGADPALDLMDTFYETVRGCCARWSRGLHLPWALILDDGLSEGKHSLVVRTTDKAEGRAALRIFQFLLN